MYRKIFVIMLGALLTACITSAAIAGDEKSRKQRGWQWVPVSGTAIHYFDNVIVHSEELTATGKTQTSSESIDLAGDLVGRVLYQPVSEFDFVAGTLVNQGRQVFSGTILGSELVVIFDDEFRFEVDLNTGATFGKAFLTDRIAGPRIKCELDIVGTGFTPEGNGLATYTGRCKVRNRR